MGVSMALSFEEAHKLAQTAAAAEAAGIGLAKGATSQFVAATRRRCCMSAARGRLLSRATGGGNTTSARHWRQLRSRLSAPFVCELLGELANVSNRASRLVRRAAARRPQSVRACARQSRFDDPISRLAWRARNVMRAVEKGKRAALSAPLGPFNVLSPGRRPRAPPSSSCHAGGSSADTLPACPRRARSAGCGGKGEAALEEVGRESEHQPGLLLPFVCGGLRGGGGGGRASEAAPGKDGAGRERPGHLQLVSNFLGPAGALFLVIACPALARIRQFCRRATLCTSAV